MRLSVFHPFSRPGSYCYFLLLMIWVENDISILFLFYISWLIKILKYGYLDFTFYEVSIMLSVWLCRMYQECQEPQRPQIYSELTGSLSQLCGCHSGSRTHPAQQVSPSGIFTSQLLREEGLATLSSGWWVTCVRRVGKAAPCTSASSSPMEDREDNQKRMT